MKCYCGIEMVEAINITQIDDPDLVDYRTTFTICSKGHVQMDNCETRHAIASIDILSSGLQYALPLN